jgi:protocatechuate 3,4-dioxygenase beta subunit
MLASSNDSLRRNILILPRQNWTLLALFFLLSLGVAGGCSSSGGDPADGISEDVAQGQLDSFEIDLEMDAMLGDIKGSDLMTDEQGEMFEETDLPDEADNISPETDSSKSDVGDSTVAEVVDMVCIPTSSDAQGPYYISGAPFVNPISGPEEPGPRIVLSGRITDSECNGVTEGVVDIWQTDAQGLYPTPEEGFRLRGKVAADSDGNYSFETVLPGLYEGRPRHVHAKVSGAGFETLTTQIYFANDPYLWPNDSCGPPTCHSDDPARIIELLPEEVEEGEKQYGELNFTLSPAQ